MTTGIIRAPFDPVTEAELAEIRAVRKEQGWDNVVLEVTADGVLDQNKRFSLLRRAIRPWKWMAAAVEETGEENVLDCSERFATLEREVRDGQYLKAASGIRCILAEEGLYLDETITALCKPSRASHSRSVAEVCVRLAEAHHLDAHKAWMMGCMHDLTKAWSDEKGRALLAFYEPSALEYDPKVYHSFTAPVFLKTVMGIQDEIILGAVKAHTLGTVRNDYDRILFIADKIEPTRGYDVSKETELALRDLKEAFALVFRESEQYRERKVNG